MLSPAIEGAEEVTSPNRAPNPNPDSDQYPDLGRCRRQRMTAEKMKTSERERAAPELKPCQRLQPDVPSCCSGLNDSRRCSETQLRMLEHDYMRQSRWLGGGLGLGVIWK